MPRLPRLSALAAVLLLAGCASDPEVRPVAETPIDGIDWRLVATGSEASVPARGAGSAVLRVDGDRFSLSGPCNQHGGAFARTGNELRFGGEGGAIMSTKKLCPGELMARESALLSALRQPLRAVFEGPYLSLVAADGASWRFDRRAAATETAGEPRVVQVAGHRAPCAGGLCLQVRTQPGAAWEPYYGDIEGFTWESGVDAVLRVRETATADGQRKWVLEEVLETGR